MRVTDDVISEVTIDIADDLTDGWCTNMSYMERFSDIRTDIVDDDGFLLASPLIKGVRGIFIGLVSLVQVIVTSSEAFARVDFTDGLNTRIPMKSA